MLLVSDPVVRDVIQEALENHGYHVFATGTLGAAVDTLKGSRPSLLITRGYVDNMPGHEAAVYLRKKCPGMPVLMLSGFPDDDRLTTRVTLNGFETFPKPYTVDEMIAKVKDVLDRAPGTRKQIP